LKEIKKTLFDNSSRQKVTVIWAFLITLKYKRQRPANREIIYHRTLKKVNRAKSGKTKKNDYVNNAMLYEKVFAFHSLSNLINYTKICKRKRQEVLMNIIDDETNNMLCEMNKIKVVVDKLGIGTDEIMHDMADMTMAIDELHHIVPVSYGSLLKRYEEEKDTTEKNIIDDIYKIAKKLINNHNFREYGEAEKDDMISFAIMKVLESKPWKGFNVYRSNSVFSFFTRAIFNYYVRHIKKYYRYHGYSGIKQKVLGSVINEFDSKWCKLGITFNLSEGMDFE
jgi:hypothetical protein